MMIIFLVFMSNDFNEMILIIINMIMMIKGPRREKTCLRGFRQNKFQTTLLSD